eukprot:scaffold189563_cov31-Tisochrysis_lutea.AAC.2
MAISLEAAVVARTTCIHCGGKEADQGKLMCRGDHGHQACASVTTPDRMPPPAQWVLMARLACLVPYASPSMVWIFFFVAASSADSRNIATFSCIPSMMLGRAKPKKGLPSSTSMGTAGRGTIVAAVTDARDSSRTQTGWAASVDGRISCSASPTEEMRRREP